jgi:transcription initiation factor TFIID subunit 5
MGHEGSIFSVSISPDKQYILSASFDESIRLWNIYLEQNLVIFKGHFSPVLSVKFSPLGFYFASGGSDKIARLWNINNISPLRMFIGHSSDIEVFLLVI